MVESENIKYSLWPKQGMALEKLSDPAIEVLGFGGAKGGGKSHCARAYSVARRIKYNASKGLIVRKSFPELERTHIEKLKKELPKAMYNYVERNHVFQLPNGSVIELGYIENEKDVDNYWGAEYDDIIIDEAQQHQKIIFQKLMLIMIILE